MALARDTASNRVGVFSASGPLGRKQAGQTAHLGLRLRKGSGHLCSAVQSVLLRNALHGVHAPGHDDAARIPCRALSGLPVLLSTSSTTAKPVLGECFESDTANYGKGSS